MAEYFPPRPEVQPTIYAYSNPAPDYKGLLKVGYTTRTAEQRIKEQFNIKQPKGLKPYHIEDTWKAMRADGSTFIDEDVHHVLTKKGIANKGGEWFRCSVKDVDAAVVAVRDRTENEENRTLDFAMRPEQQAAVEKACAYFQSVEAEGARIPKFLWNCKMRFGKTFAAYQLALRMKMKRVLVLTFKPAVLSAWRDDLASHIDFEGWQFIAPDTELKYETADKNRPLVCFGSFQDYLGVNKENGGIRPKPRNEWVHALNWDMVIFDEYHFGAWKDNAKKLFEQEDDDKYDSIDIERYDRGNAYDESFLPITTRRYLYLSGTPFRALNSGEFIEEQIYNWTYSDEQKAKTEWTGESNPYAALPRMVMMAYQIPESIRKIAMQGEFNEFDLNVFFSAEGKEDEAQFLYKSDVQKWLELIRGAFAETVVDDLKTRKPVMPYANARLLNVLQHTLWFLPNVSACYAMKNLLEERHNTFYHGYKVNVCAGAAVDNGAAALVPVQKSMEDPLDCKTITLSCGKLTTGVTVKPWTGIFMLRNLSSPETYFQAAFRVQSPWEIATDDGRKEILKQECYVFDFALDRALRQIADYSCKLDVNGRSPEDKVGEFINFLPVIAYDGMNMRQINARDILDMAMAGTSATLLAKRWESALLVNVDNDTLARLMANQDAMDALMKIEGFRSLNEDIKTIIAKSDAVKKAKKDGEKTTPDTKRPLSEEEKEYKSKRKQIQDKLIKFATRIPIFMYLTDNREQCLKDVITQLEPELFRKVTGLAIKDFELLVSQGVFNDSLMNDAVYKFKRYEDASLSYTGISKHEEEHRGGWNTTITEEEFARVF